MNDRYMRERLDRVLMLVENGKNSLVQEQTAWLISIIPDRMPFLKRGILLIEKPVLTAMVDAAITNNKENGRRYSQAKALEQFKEFRAREDMIGQICDMFVNLIECTVDDDCPVDAHSTQTPAIHDVSVNVTQQST